MLLLSLYIHCVTNPVCTGQTALPYCTLCVVCLPFKNAVSWCFRIMSGINESVGTRHWQNDADTGGPTYSEKNLSQCNLVYHKSYKDWRCIETGPSPWFALDWPHWIVAWPELVNLCGVLSKIVAFSKSGILLSDQSVL